MSEYNSEYKQICPLTAIRAGNKEIDGPILKSLETILSRGQDDFKDPIDYWKARLVSSEISNEIKVNEIKIDYERQIDDMGEQLILKDRKIEESEEKTKIDNRTGLLNDKGLNEAIEEYRKKADQTGKNFGFILVDIDTFKPYNDRFNYEIGNAVLRAVACTLKRYTDPKDKIARDGGDEYQILLYDVDKETTKKVVDRLTEKIKEEAYKEASKEIEKSKIKLEEEISKISDHSKLQDIEQKKYEDTLNTISIYNRFLTEPLENIRITASMGHSIYYGGLGTDMDVIKSASKKMISDIKKEKGIKR